MAKGGKFRFAIDRGGTFTDVYAETPNGPRVLKLLSVDAAYPDAPREGIRRILEQETGIPHPRSQLVDTSRIDWIRMGTTVATNALLERQGERVVLCITKGFRDVLHIGNQSRPSIFDLQVKTPEVLYEHVVEVEERLVLDADGPVQGSTGERLQVEQPVNVEKLRQDLQVAFDAGIRSVVVTLMHAYLYDAHERAVGDIARQIGFSHVSLSSEVIPMVRIVPRGFTASADAYLTPHIHRYIQGFRSGFVGNLAGCNVSFMQSDGGLTSIDRFIGSRAILSGPAGGVVGYAATAYDPVTKQPVIGFDMGGTSTDVSRYAGSHEHVYEAITAGIPVQAPQLDINTVAAGGGSRLFFRDGMFVVGPESGGADPGPVCYRKGGKLCLTDANVFLGRVRPEFFPKVFGHTEDQPLDAEATREAFLELTEQVNAFRREATSGSQTPMTPQEVALGFVRVANEAMCRPIRSLTQAKGHNTSDHILSCFGGAGGQHACAIAQSLDITKIHVHKYSGILSAYGLACAEVVKEMQTPCADSFAEENLAKFWSAVSELAVSAASGLQADGIPKQQIAVEPFLNMRYQGTDCALMVPLGDGVRVALDDMALQPASRAADFGKEFRRRYQREFGFLVSDRDILVDDIRVRAIGSATNAQDCTPAQLSATAPKPVAVHPVWFDVESVDTPFFEVREAAGHAIKGPAILIDACGTIVVEPNCTANVDQDGDIEIVIGTGKPRPIGTELDLIHLSVFSHRFMSIAEEMGRSLQRTSISTNIKERLDFSCALFDPSGGLVANAPHIPVHLGAMQEAVRFQINHLGSNLNRGDVLVSNHPCAGGSHLPDITVITPVFRDDAAKPVFFVASRGHHADIGGITPGSMPPASTSLRDEGASIVSFKLVSNGKFDEQGITTILSTPTGPGCSGTRNLADNLSDLRAQVAANQRGTVLVNQLIDQVGLDVVVAYMEHVQQAAEFAVRQMLKDVAAVTRERTGSTVLRAVDYMDDGSPICLRVAINEEEGSAVFDFTGTGVQVLGNCNAPRAVAYSGVIYCLRCMVGHEVPLNQGCLTPVNIKIPQGSLLWPSDDAAVVGGNVLTSQRVVDVVLKAFEACAASQGCMNNTTFGDETLGYYETVAGGAGAGPGWHGRSGVHTHMTNTRITDPEILERRYPVVLQKFMLRDGSGGQGRFRGGDGVVRELRFRRPLKLSILSERRALAPFGLQGGSDGARGKNYLIRKGGQAINLGSKVTVDVKEGDVFRLLSPGGGGFGARAAEPEAEGDHKQGPQTKRRRQDKAAVSAPKAGGSLGTYKARQESA
eukprot:m.356716 g.356716  ORF g.356716 m.356716 type:complete len:1301 (+) comp19933_c0_seq2:767-4669(+)